MLSKPPILFSDLAWWGVVFLRSGLASRSVLDEYAENVNVSTQVPSEMPTRLVTVRDDGGPRDSAVMKINSLGLNVWAESEAACSDLARFVAALFETSPGNGPVVAHLSTSGPFPVPDQSGKPHRYLSVDLSVRGDPL